MIRLRMVAACLVVAACGRDAPAPVDRGLARDLVSLREGQGQDPVESALTDVERQVRLRKPVRAAEMLRSVAIPAAEQHLADLNARVVETPEGQRLHGVVVSACQARLASLEQYASALQRGEQEDVVLFDAIRAQRLAAEQLLMAYEEVDRAEVSMRARSR